MRVDVTLGTTFASWELLDGERWRSTVSDSLLYEGQHIIAIRTPDDESFEEEILEQVLESLEFYVRRETGTPYVLERYASSGDGLLMDLGRVLGIDSEPPSRLAVIDALEVHYGQGALMSTFVLVVSKATVQEHESSKGLIDLMRSRECPVPTIIILYGSALELERQRNAFDFSRARPVPAAREAVCATRLEERWAAYLHHRVAWFSNGHLGIVSALQPYIRGLIDGDDENLEASFNDFSRYYRTQVEPTLWDALKESMGRNGVSVEDVRSVLHARRTTLFTRLYWQLLQADGLFDASLVPWVARAFLLEIGKAWAIDHLIHDWLRHHLICLPLQRGALGLCLEIEGRLKHMWWESFEGECVGDEGVEKVQDGYRAHSRSALPPSFPGQALDVGPPFVSLGFIIHHTCTVEQFSSDRQRPLQAFRTVRNALAHNHHIGWAQLEKVRHCLNSYAL